MVLKKLHELSASELRTELKRAGIKGKFIKTQAIVRLTTYLIDVSEDPGTFEFDTDVPVDELQVEGEPGDYEVTNDNDTPDTAVGSTAASVSRLVESIVAGASGVNPSTSLPSVPTAFVGTSTATITSTTNHYLYSCGFNLLFISKSWPVSTFFKSWKLSRNAKCAQLLVCQIPWFCRSLWS